MTVLVCPDCKGFDDRPDDLCGMCSDPGVAEEFCLHERYERFHAGCDCSYECEWCGADLESDQDECWRCGR